MTARRALARACLDDARARIVDQLLAIGGFETADAIDADMTADAIIDAAQRDAARIDRSDRVRAAVVFGSLLGAFCNERLNADG